VKAIVGLAVVMILIKKITLKQRLKVRSLSCSSVRLLSWCFKLNAVTFDAVAPDGGMNKKNKKSPET